MIDRYYQGAGCLSRLGAVLEALNARRVFLVTGRASWTSSGAESAVLGALAGREVVHFTGFEPNPHLEDVTRGLARFAADPCDLVLGVGGGTALDVAKLVAVLSQHPGVAPVDLVCARRPITSPALPLIAIPTTAGTGSEATHFAVCYVGHDKYSVAHPSLRPTVALVDPDLLRSVPGPIAAATGLDALAQALESLWSVNATDSSRSLALEAAALAYAHLPAAATAPTDVARAAMSRAAHLAGRAIDITRTTAPHAISYTLTSFFGVPHGHAVALTLGPVLAYNAAATADDVTHPGGVAAVQGALALVVDVLGATDPTDAADRLDRLIGRVGLERRLSALGVGPADHQLIVQRVNLQRLKNNPRALSADTLAGLLASVG